MRPATGLRAGDETARSDGPPYEPTKERTLPAGTRLRIFSGRASEPFTSQPLEEVRHVASEFEHGELAFDANGVELRVVESGTPAHQRGVASDDAYVATPVRVLRRPDGTGYAVVPEAGGARF